MSRARDYGDLAGRTWKIWQNDDLTVSQDQLTLLLLQDIRAELQKLNALLGCRNVAAGFRALQSIARVQRANLKREVEREIRRRERQAKR